MRDETKRKLDAQIRENQSLERWALIFGATLAVGFGLLAIASNVTISAREVGASVQSAAWKIDHETGDNFAELQIVLDDGRLVIAGTRLRKLPALGTKIIAREKVLGTGYHSYTWNGETPEAK